MGSSNGGGEQVKHIDAAKAFADRELVTAAVNRALRRARIAHKQQDIPMATWRDGKAILIPPGQIEIDVGSNEH
jgi:hypothetical protein